MRKTMKRLCGIFTLLFLFAFAAGPVYAVEDYEKFRSLAKLTDEFYGGLADIIEQNMDNPKACVGAVEDYYQANENRVTQIRSGIRDFFEEMASLAEKSTTMPAEEFKAFAAAEEARLKEISEPSATSGGERYVKAMEKFSTKYPEYGLKVAAKAVKLFPIPDMAGGENKNLVLQEREEAR